MTTHFFEWIEYETGWECRIGPLFLRYGPTPHRGDTPPWWRVDLRASKTHLAGTDAPSVEMARVEAEKYATDYLNRKR